MQRVARASVEVDGIRVGAIERGLLVFIGVMRGDTPDDLAYIVTKTAELRVFPDDAGRMNRDVHAAGGAILAISQFTLAGDCRNGRRPAFTAAEVPDAARRLYDAAVDGWRARGLPVESGVFGAHMDVSLVNDGPVTILLDSARQF